MNNIYDFVKEIDKDHFMHDIRTQQAVVMNLIIIGESAAKVMDRHPEFVLSHSQVAWRSMRGMRNRIVHDYFDINLDTVWETVTGALPQLADHLPSMILDAKQE